MKKRNFMSVLLYLVGLALLLGWVLSIFGSGIDNLSYSQVVERVLGSVRSRRADAVTKPMPCIRSPAAGAGMSREPAHSINASARIATYTIITSGFLFFKTIIISLLLVCLGFQDSHIG